MNHARITASCVVAVLLADGWHTVIRGSFTVGPLAFGGAEENTGVPGYRFEEADSAGPHGPTTLAGPLTALLGVRQAPPGKRHRRTGLAAAPAPEAA